MVGVLAPAYRQEHCILGGIMHSKRILPAFVVLILAVTACGDGISADPPQASRPLPTATSTPTASATALTPKPTASKTTSLSLTPSPTLASNAPYWMDTGSGAVQEVNLDLEYYGGYKASAHVEWYAQREVSPSSVPFVNNQTDVDDWAVRAIRVNATFTPEAVNGFDWPTDAPFGLVFGTFGSSGAQTELNQGYLYLDESGNYVPPMQAETGPMYYADADGAMKVAADIVYLAKKTPTNPEGEWEGNSFDARPITVAVPYCSRGQEAKGIDIKSRTVTLRAAQWGSNVEGCWLMPQKVYADPFG